MNPFEFDTEAEDLTDLDKEVLALEAERDALEEALEIAEYQASQKKLKGTLVEEIKSLKQRLKKLEQE